MFLDGTLRIFSIRSAPATQRETRNTRLRSGRGGAGGHPQILSAPNVSTSELALVGNALYWTEAPGTARSATLPGAVPASSLRDGWRTTREVNIRHAYRVTGRPVAVRSKTRTKGERAIVLPDRR